ncbi:hypothetical protein H8356DRAFT_1743606, partial [Neocallimastix lanati (nom. inval.)]
MNILMKIYDFDISFYDISKALGIPKPKNFFQFNPYLLKNDTNISLLKQNIDNEELRKYISIDNLQKSKEEINNSDYEFRFVINENKISYTLYINYSLRQYNERIIREMVNDFTIIINHLDYLKYSLQDIENLLPEKRMSDSYNEIKLSNILENEELRIETAMKTIEGIEDAYVITTYDNNMNKHLLCYYKCSKEIGAKSLQNQLKLKLPNELIPEFLQKVEFIPRIRNRNGYSKSEMKLKENIYDASKPDLNRNTSKRKNLYTN